MATTKSKTTAKKPASRSTKPTKTTKTTTSHAARLSGRGAGFVQFIREQGVVGLAVGLAIGTAAGDTVKKLVEAFISPIVQLIVGSQKGLEAATFTLDLGSRTGEFKWGAFVSSLITLLATALVIYLIVHFMKLDRLDRKKDA